MSRVEASPSTSGIAEGRLDRLPMLAAELVQLNPDLILAIGTDVAQAVLRATHTIPLVMGSSLDPVRAGLVASLAQPGGNLTGVSYLVDRLNPKRLELLKQLVPGASRVAVLWRTQTIPTESFRSWRRPGEHTASRSSQSRSLRPAPWTQPLQRWQATVRTP
jgi:hypothetical protein